jgi:hypothetical protein
MPNKTERRRVTFSPGEFAALFGKSQTWGYRQIYAGKVQAITEFGRILIPAAEVEKILETACRYEGKLAHPKSKEEFGKLVPTLPNAWQDYLKSRRRAGTSVQEVAGPVPKPVRATNRRREVFDRLRGRNRAASDEP